MALKLWPCCHLLVSTSHCRHDWNYFETTDWFIYDFLFAPYCDFWTWAFSLCFLRGSITWFCQTLFHRPSMEITSNERWSQHPPLLFWSLSGLWPFGQLQNILFNDGFSSAPLRYPQKPRKQDTFSIFLRLFTVACLTLSRFLLHIGTIMLQYTTHPSMSPKSNALKMEPPYP